MSNDSLSISYHSRMKSLLGYETLKNLLLIKRVTCTQTLESRVGLPDLPTLAPPELASKSREKRRLCRKLLSARSCQASSYSLLLIMPPSFTTATVLRTRQPVSKAAAAAFKQKWTNRWTIGRLVWDKLPFITRSAAALQVVG